MIVRRKLAIPSLPAGWIDRPVALGRLAAGLDPDCRVTLVAAGPGMGKTSLLAAYARRPLADDGTGPALVTWYSLASEDSDPGVFFPHLFAALRLALPDLPRQAADVHASLGTSGLTQAAGVLCDDLETALGERRLVAVIDDAQHAPAGPGAVAAIETLVRYFPESSQLILSGRTLPPIKWAQYEAKGQVLAIGDSELRFSPGEIAGLPGNADAAKLCDLTGGWPAGIAHALRHPQPGGGPLSNPGALYRYLREEILEHLPEDLLGDLAALALVDDPAAGRFAGLIGASQVESLLALPALAGFLWRQDDMIALQPIFREAIVQHIEATWERPGVAALCLRVAEAAPSPSDAVPLLIRAQDWDAAEARLIEGFPALMDAGRTAWARSLAGAIPVKRRATPGLLFVLGEIERREGRFRDAVTLLEEAHRLPGIAGPFRGKIAAALAAAYGAQGDRDKQCTLARNALDWLDPADASAVASCWNVLGLYQVSRFDLGAAKLDFERAMAAYTALGDTRGRVRVQHNLGFGHGRLGDFRRAIAHYLEALRLADAGGHAPLPTTYSNLALCEIYLGRLAEAQGRLESGMALAERLMAQRDKAVMTRTLGRLHLARGAIASAQACFEAALAEGLVLGDSDTQVYAHIGRAEAALLRGDAGAAALAAEQALAAGMLEPGEPAAVDCTLVLGRAAMAAGNLDESSRMLEAVMAGVAAAPSSYVEYLAARLGAALAARRGSSGGAEGYLARCSELAAEFGYPDPPPGYPDLHGIPAAAVSAPAPRASANQVVPQLDVAAFGPFEVKVDGILIPAGAWSVAKTRIALAYLLAHPGGVTKEALVDLLFPDETAVRTAANMVLSRVRQGLDPGVSQGTPSRFVIFQAGRYFLNQGMVMRFDVAEFRARLGEARRAGAVGAGGEASCASREEALKAATALYRGPFLDGIEKSPWAEIEREGLRRQMTGAFAERFALAAGRDAWEDLGSAASELIDRDPSAQEGHRAAILALVFQDRQDAARRACAAARDFLESGCHAALEPETEDLFDQVEAESLTVKAARSLLALS
jgi:ATP/maltotriose-dependent transcriptional regulator MalT/DNA-binding SARP family transcriptional activator